MGLLGKGIFGIARDYLDKNHIENENEITKEIENGKVSDNAKQLATWIIQKKFGKDTRYAMALDVLLKDKQFNDYADQFENIEDLFKDLNENFDDLNDQFKDVLANATQDSEVINARDSSRFGKFKVLDDRLENDEDLISSTVPTEGIFNDSVYDSSLGYHPTLSVIYYENAVGTSGFLQNDVVFGDSVVVPVGITYSPSHHWTVKVPKKYYIKASSVASTTEPNVWYKTIEDGNVSKTLRLEFKKEV